MPRPGPVRPSVTLRLDADTLAYLDAVAAEMGEGVTRSDLVRFAIRQAMQDHWTPPKSIRL